MRKSLVVLVGAAVVLVAIYLAMSYSEQKSMAPREASNFVGLDSGVVNKIVIKRLGGAVELDRAGDGWNVIDNGKPQKAEKMGTDQIANVAHNLTVGDIISSNPDKQMLFQVDTIMGRTIEFYRDDQMLGSLVIGKPGSDFRSTYVRKPESNDVYLTSAPLSRLVDRNARAFRDKVISPIDTATITSVDIASKDFTYSIVKMDSLWTVNSNKEGTFIADHNKATQLVNLLGNLRVADFVSDEERDTVNFAAASEMVTVHLSGGNQLSLVLMPKSDERKDYYIRLSNSEGLFVVFEGTRNSLIKKPDDFKPGAA